MVLLIEKKKDESIKIINETIFLIFFWHIFLLSHIVNTFKGSIIKIKTKVDI